MFEKNDNNNYPEVKPLRQWELTCVTINLKIIVKKMTGESVESLIQEKTDSERFKDLNDR